MLEQFTTDKEGNSIINIEYIIHNRQDNLLSSWLLSSISSGLLPQLIGCKNSHEI